MLHSGDKNSAGKRRENKGRGSTRARHCRRGRPLITSRMLALPGVLMAILLFDIVTALSSCQSLKPMTNYIKATVNNVKEPPLTKK